MTKFPFKYMRDVTRLITDGKHGDCEDEEGSGYYFLSSKDLRDGRLSYDDFREIRYDGFLETHRRTQLTPGDILLANCGASIGRVGIAQNDPRIYKTTFQKSISVIKADQTIVNGRFLYYFFLCNSNHLIELGGGTAQPNLLIGDLKRIKVPLPPLPTQRKIAAILSAYDDLIENNNRRIAILEKMAEELYREWFVRLRFPGHDGVKIVKGVPEGWEVKKIGEIVHATMGQSPASEYYNTNGIGLPFNQGVGTYGERFPRREVYCESPGRIAEEGDILFSVRAPVGRLNIADCKMIIGRGLAAFRHRQNYNSYLFYLLKVCFSSEDMIGNGAIFNAVTKDELLGFQILTPASELIRQFDEQASVMDRQIRGLIKSIELLKDSRDRLLSRLMSGKIDVEKLDIEFPMSMQDSA